MSVILTYKYRIKDRSARKTLRRYAYSVNQVWNYCNAVQRDVEARYRAGGLKRKWPTDFDLQKLSKGTSKLLGIHAQTIAVVCQQFARSRNEAKRSLRFRASGGPRRALGWIPFQKQSRQVQNNTVRYLGKTFRWFGNKRRPLPETAKGGAFVEDSLGRWHICFHVEVADEMLIGSVEVGIDLGLKTMATRSDGQKIEAPQIYRRYEIALATAQRAGNRRRARALHAKIKNCRRDFLHKASTSIVRDNALIAVGNVSSSLAKTRMAKSVLDAGWSMFRSQLRYKASRHGAVYLDVDEKFTTQTCSQCGALPPERPRGIAGLGIREWDCSACGASHDRDVNAARNILALALSAQRRGDESRGIVAHG